MNWMRANAEEIVSYIRSVDDPLIVVHLAQRLERGERIDRAVEVMLELNQRLIEQNCLLNHTLLATPPMTGNGLPYPGGH